MATTEVDCAIIGGGVAGVYCGWRLTNSKKRQKVFLFEYTNRIGGRLFTVPKLGNADINAEIGGMRYNPAQHKLFSFLLKKLGLTPKEFPMGSGDDQTGNKNFVYFRGEHARIGDLNNSDKIPFKVSWSERNKNPDDLQEQIIKTLIPTESDRTDANWPKVKVFGKSLYKWGYWNLLYHVLSQEAYLFMKFGCGYDTNVSNGNAAVLLPTGGDYTNENKYLTLEEGMNEFPKRLEEQFRKNGGKTFTNYRLESIERLKGGKNPKYALRFFKTHTVGRKTSDSLPQEEFVIHANKVILAMPRAALEKIRFEQWEKNNEYKQNRNSVLVQAAMKIYLAYPYAWWKSIGLIAGRSITDLPIRQVFYFVPKDDTNLNTVYNKTALLMASYNDIESVPFWKGLEGSSENNEEDEYFPGDDNCRATTAMVDEAHKQVMELHDLKQIPQPSAAAYWDWGDTVSGGGWHCWKAGYDFNEICKKMLKPDSKENVYICGEAYSLWQGWAEGALQTAEDLLLTDDFGLDPILPKEKPTSIRRGLNVQGTSTKGIIQNRLRWIYKNPTSKKVQDTR